jgi:quercetin dioxygenase-like cupin family protein
MSNFRFISYDENYQPILQQVLDNPNDWSVVSTYKNIAGDLKPYGFLPLVMAVVRNVNDSPKDTELQQATTLYSKYTEIHKWLLSKNIKGTSRAAFFRLKVDGSVNRHIDDGKYYLTRDRYHLALQGEYLYEVDGEEHIIKPGTFFWFDNKKMHSARNISNIDRITFVFDVPKSPNNP